MRKRNLASRTDYFCCMAAAAMFISAPQMQAFAADTATAPAADVTLTSPVPKDQGVLTASKVSYQNGKISAEGSAENPVVYRSGPVTITAQKVLLDTIGQTVSASGTVVVERQLTSKRRKLTPERLAEDYTEETITETLRGDHFFYDYGKQQGNLDNVSIRLADFNLSAEKLIINGQRYIAKNVIIRPGGLSPEELKIYGTPPLNLRAESLTLDTSQEAPTAGVDLAQNAGSSHQPSLTAENAGLYFKNTKIMPVPDYVLRQTSLGRRNKKAFSITPSVSVGSEDGLLLTTQLQYAFNRDNPEKLMAIADLGLSLKQGFRGGIGLNSDTKFGSINLNVHINDIVSNQIEHRVLLNRMPEINYRAPQISLLNLPGGRRAGLLLGASWGRYRETNLGNDQRVESTRQQLYAKFTTRLANPRGPYLELYARRAKYSNFNQDYTTFGYEIGFYDNITNYIDGQFSYSHTNVSGSTPFTFDKVEIRSELRATFDILVTPRYIIPIDLRYDLDQHEFRDKSFGIMRNYKTFAYGLMYNTARRELSLEFRQGF